MDILSRVVVDTNILVSQWILPDSLPAKVLAQAEMRSVLLFSELTMSELADVLSRPSLIDTSAMRPERVSFNALGGLLSLFPSFKLCMSAATRRTTNY
jgi:predicted nucleic acid-binding protein